METKKQVCVAKIKRMTILYIDNDIYNELRKIATRDNRSLSSAVAHVVKHYVGNTKQKEGE